MKYSGFFRTLAIISLMIAALTLWVVPSFADDGRIDPRPGDRIAVYCQTTTLDVYGVDDLSRGVFLGAFTYGDLFRSGAITFNTANGQVTAGVNSHGVFFARWLGGAVNATGVGDFAKSFRCPSSFYTPPSIPSTPAGGGQLAGGQPITDSLTLGADGASVVIQQTATNTGSGSITQSVVLQADGTVFTASNIACGGSAYTVRTGDTLFRIARRFGTTVQNLAACNAIANPNRIFVGQVISVP